jgi:hypothetical protein
VAHTFDWLMLTVVTSNWHHIQVNIVYDAIAYQATDTLAVVDSTKFAVNDIVSVVITYGWFRCPSYGLAVNTDYIISYISGDYIT